MTIAEFRAWIDALHYDSLLRVESLRQQHCTMHDVTKAHARAHHHTIDMIRNTLKNVTEVEDTNKDTVAKLPAEACADCWYAQEFRKIAAAFNEAVSLIEKPQT